MGVYTVLAPPVRDGGSLPDPMAFAFVKEGFSWPALFFAGPWLIYHRMWLVLAGYVLLALGLGIIARPLGGALPGDVLILIHLLFALEANELRRWTLQRRSYRLVGVVQGRGIEEAEIRYFAAAEEPVAVVQPTPPTPPSLSVPPVPPQRPTPARPSAEAGDVVGLFPAPGAMA